MLIENADARFELWIAGIRSDRSANFTTLTVPVKVFDTVPSRTYFLGPFSLAFLFSPKGRGNSRVVLRFESMAMCD